MYKRPTEELQVISYHGKQIEKKTSGTLLSERKNDSCEPYHRSTHSKHNTHFFTFIRSKSLAAHTGKGVAMKAQEELVRGCCFSLPSPSRQPKGPGKTNFGHLSSPTKQFQFSFHCSARSKGNLFVWQTVNRPNIELLSKSYYLNKVLKRQGRIGLISETAHD